MGLHAGGRLEAADVAARHAEVLRFTGAGSG